MMPAENRRIALQLREAWQLLRAQGANPFRAEAYLRAAATVENLDRPVRDFLDTPGMPGLQALPGIGKGIAAAIAEMLITGRWAMLCRLRGEADADAHAQADAGAGVLPRVELLLDVDREYREQAAAGRLPNIAPWLNAGDGRALPVLHTCRGEWHFTALYSNTRRAHELGKTRDWVVIYFYDGDHHERQCTVVTETRGTLGGSRVVRGREGECKWARLRPTGS